MTREEFAIALLERCSHRNISHCVLRDYEMLPDMIGHDLDLAVSTQDYAEFERCIEELIIQYGLNCVRLDKRSDYNSYAIIISLEVEGILKIDIWNELRWRGLNWFDIEKIISCAVNWKGVKVAAPEYRTAIRIWKDLVFTGKIPDRAKDRVVSEVQQSLDEVKEIAGQYLGDTLGEKLINSITMGNWEQTACLSKSIRRKLLLKHLKINISDLFDAIGGVVVFASSFVKKVLRPYGKLVVLVGPDGSGKTTLASKLLETLPRLLFVKGHYVYYRFGILPELKSIFGASLTKRCGGDNKVQAGQPLSAIRAILMTLYYSLDFALGYFKVLFWKARGHIIVTDRYYYDYYLQPHWKNAPRWFLRFCEIAVPKPDLILFLYCQPELIRKRKPELEVDEIASQQDKVKGLASRLKPTVQIPTVDGVEITEKAAVLAIIETLPKFSKKGDCYN